MFFTVYFLEYFQYQKLFQIKNWTKVDSKSKSDFLSSGVSNLP